MGMVRRSWVVCGGSVLLLMLSLGVKTPSALGQCAWRIAKSPNPADSNSFRAIDGGGEDLWAVGTKQNDGRAERTLTTHRSASGWDVVPSPNANRRDNRLADASYLNADSVWATGWFDPKDPSVDSKTLVLHWDGQEWSLINSPNTDRVGTLFGSISAVTDDDVWAVGGSHGREFRRVRTLIAHYDGERWSLTPHPEMRGELVSVDAVAADDVWAVGSFRESGKTQTLAMHFDGVAWTVVPTPNPTANVDVNQLYDVSAGSSSDVWAVGMRGNSSPLVEHFDGVEWTVVDADEPQEGNGTLFAVSAGTEAVGVGYASSSDEAHTLIEQGDLSGWVPQSSPNSAAPFNVLRGVLSQSGGSWAVGSRGWPSERQRTLTMKCT